MIFYTRAKLIADIKLNGLPHGKPTLNILERTNVIPKGAHRVIFGTKKRMGTNEIRIYTQDEIDGIIVIMKNFYPNYDKKAKIHQG